MQLLRHILWYETSCVLCEFYCCFPEVFQLPRNSKFHDVYYVSGVAGCGFFYDPGMMEVKCKGRGLPKISTFPLHNILGLFLCVPFCVVPELGDGN